MSSCWVLSCRLWNLGSVLYDLKSSEDLQKFKTQWNIETLDHEQKVWGF